MPTSEHDFLTGLFETRPRLAVEILTDVFGRRDVPTDLAATVTSNDFNDRPSRNFTPDKAIVVGSPHNPRHGIIVEIQKEKSEAKRKQLPRYQAALWLALDRSVTTLVLCTKPDVADYYARPIPTDLPTYACECVVLGPREVPAITDPEQVVRNLELAAISLVVHQDNPAVVEAFTDAELRAPDSDAPYYREYVYGFIQPRNRHLWSKIMQTRPVLANTPQAKAIAEQSLAQAVLKVIKSRGICLTEEQRQRVLTCHDTDQLDTWLDRASTATNADDIFG
ncbi:hypothetical protein [Actinomadura flavalba]|uniref:hypothetical protein n=1 Tax=Actinomadura flavalba TaxID=1120938 RepID=UPI00037E1412|nr:hypothetical protein [Actinomadura flavalba]